MTEALAVLQGAVGVALVLLGLFSAVDWLRHRGRSRRYLALTVCLLALITPFGRLGLHGAAGSAVTAVSVAMLMGSSYALLLFRHSLIPVRAWWLRGAAAGLVVVSAAGIAVNLKKQPASPAGLALAVDVALLLSWCVVVGLSIFRLWRVSGTLPRVQRARLRALNVAFTGLIVALVGTVFTTASRSSETARLVVECVVLLSIPWLGVSMAPPGWLRRVWREREEASYRLAMNNLLLYSPDEATLASRVLEWGTRLLGGGAAMIALDGHVLAASGITAAEAQSLHSELEALRNEVVLSFGSSLGPTAVVPLHSEAGSGYFAVVGGPFTPLFGDVELARLGQYAVSITLALDRVHLVAGMRSNAELLDLAYDAIFSWDFQSGLIGYWNRAASDVYGYTAEEAQGREPQPLLKSDYGMPREDVVAALRAEGHWEGEIHQSTKDGRVLAMSARWAVQRDATGEPVTVIEINRDISDQKRAALDLQVARDVAEQASNAKSEYLSRMSHELRTPLAAMLGFSDLLEMREPREDQMQAIEAIQRAGSHLLSLVNDVLDIARIEAGRETLLLRPLDVALVLNECLGLVSQTAGTRHVTLRLDLEGLDGERVFVRADRQRLVQVLLNLLSNAIKYGSEGGHVVARVSAVEQAVEVAVTDDGPGLTEEQQSRLFQPFERLGAERSHVPGTGLGLALARQLTVAMGGTIRARSAGGQGTTFTVRLQRAFETDAESRVAAASPPVLRDAATERTVLYVEDSLATISLVESIFALRPNVRLLTAMQGGLALELAREHLPDLVILDLHLPDLHGDEVIARLRQDPRTADIPVVMYSADATERQVERLLAAGAAAYMTKPARVQDFLGTVDRVLGEHDRLQRRA